MAFVHRDLHAIGMAAPWSVWPRIRILCAWLGVTGVRIPWISLSGGGADYSQEASATGGPRRTAEICREVEAHDIACLGRQGLCCGLHPMQGAMKIVHLIEEMQDKIDPRLIDAEILVQGTDEAPAREIGRLVLAFARRFDGFEPAILNPQAQSCRRQA